MHPISVPTLPTLVNLPIFGLRFFSMVFRTVAILCALPGGRLPDVEVTAMRQILLGLAIIALFTLGAMYLLDPNTFHDWLRPLDRFVNLH
jgi:MFS-type transporter involved in bile tolerance (Atg22 family)